MSKYTLENKISEMSLLSLSRVIILNILINNTLVRKLMVS
jgi:hypothetical protein